MIVPAAMIDAKQGEGWDQPMVEAAASGLRPIAPDHTAYQAVAGW